jgi:hypothetical protein
MRAANSETARKAGAPSPNFSPRMPPIFGPTVYLESTRRVWVAVSANQAKIAGSKLRDACAITEETAAFRLYQSIHLSIHLSIYLSLFLFLSPHLSLTLRLYIYLSIYVSLSLSSGGSSHPTAISAVSRAITADLSSTGVQSATIARATATVCFASPTGSREASRNDPVVAIPAICVHQHIL